MPDKSEAKVDKEIARELNEVTAYPILTEEVRFPTPGPAAPGGQGGLPLRQTVEATMRQVLGWRPKVGDTKGFIAALNQSFALQEIEGHTETTWTPRSYTAQVQADMGAITGAQASIFSRAKVALDQSLPLLNGLTPLRPDFDAEDCESVRAIVRSEISEIVNELGLEGGPRVSRVDQLFDLLGAVPGAKGVDDVTGHLAMLLSRFGLEQGYVNTIEEEQDLTNFLIVVDYLNSLRSSWENLKGYFEIGNTTQPAFMGTQLVLLTRALDVVVESIQEVHFVMDSVFLGPAERQTILLKDAAPDQPIFFADLMAWVDRFASEEGRRMIQDSGKDGVNAFTATAVKLRDLVSRALVTNGGGPSGQNPSDPDIPPSYRTARVQVALKQLAAELGDAVNRAAPIGRVPAPKISSAGYTPDPFRPRATNKDVTFDVYGIHLDPRATVMLVPMPGQKVGEIKARTVPVTRTHIHAVFSIQGGIAEGTTWALAVVNPDQSLDVLENAFTIEAPAATAAAAAKTAREKDK